MAAARRATAPTSSLRRRLGLTLLELIVVVVILAVISAIAVPTFVSVIDQSKIRTEEVTASTILHDAELIATANTQSAPTVADMEQAVAETTATAAGTGVLAAGLGPSFALTSTAVPLVPSVTYGRVSAAGPGFGAQSAPSPTAAGVAFESAVAGWAIYAYAPSHGHVSAWANKCPQAAAVVAQLDDHTGCVVATGHVPGAPFNVIAILDSTTHTYTIYWQMPTTNASYYQVTYPGGTCLTSGDGACSSGGGAASGGSSTNPAAPSGPGADYSTSIPSTGIGSPTTIVVTAYSSGGSSSASHVHPATGAGTLAEAHNVTYGYTSGTGKTKVAWIAGSGTAPASWVVEYTDGGRIVTDTISGASTSTTLTGDYRVVGVYPESSSGASGFVSAPTGVVTSAPTSPKPSTGGTTVTETATVTTTCKQTVTVEWTGPKTQGSTPITSYTVTSTPSAVSRTVPATTHEVTMGVATGLTGSATYSFYVVATNAFGTSPRSLLSNTVTLGCATTAGTGTTTSGAPGTGTGTGTATTTSSGGPITLVSHSSNNSSSMSLVVTAPTNIAAGDELVAIALNADHSAAGAAGATFTPPSGEGWTLVASTHPTTANSDTFAIYHTTATTSEPSSFTWSSNAYYNAVTILNFSGVTTSDPVTTYAFQSANGTTTHTVTFPSVTTSYAGEKLVLAAGTYWGVTVTAPRAQGIAAVTTVNRTSGAQGVQVWTTTKTSTGPSVKYGATESEDTSNSKYGFWNTLTMALRPAT